MSEEINQEGVKEEPVLITKIEDGKYKVETSISISARVEEIQQKFISLDEQEAELNNKLAAISNTRQILNEELLLLK